MLTENFAENKDEKRLTAKILNRLINMQQFLKVGTNEELSKAKSTVKAVQRYIKTAAEDNEFLRQMVLKGREVVSLCDDNTAMLLAHLHLLDMQISLKKSRSDIHTWFIKKRDEHGINYPQLCAELWIKLNKGR